MQTAAYICLWVVLGGLAGFQMGYFISAKRTGKITKFSYVRYVLTILAMFGVVLLLSQLRHWPASSNVYVVAVSIVSALLSVLVFYKLRVGLKR